MKRVSKFASTFTKMMRLFKFSATTPLLCDALYLHEKPVEQLIELIKHKSSTLCVMPGGAVAHLDEFNVLSATFENWTLAKQKLDALPPTPASSSSSRPSTSSLSPKPMALGATVVLCLMNMVVEEELRDPDEYDDLLDNIRRECAKYGAVRSCEIPRPIPGVVVPGVGRVFLEYDSVQDAVNASWHLNGRCKFANRFVISSYFDPDKYYRREF